MFGVHSGVRCRVHEGVCRNVKRFRGGLVFKAHRLVYHSTLGWRVIKKKKYRKKRGIEDGVGQHVGMRMKVRDLGFGVYRFRAKREHLGRI